MQDAETENLHMAFMNLDQEMERNMKNWDFITHDKGFWDLNIKLLN